MSDKPHRDALCYVASPYSNYFGGDLQKAMEDVARICAKLIPAGVKCYSPIVHTHMIAIYGDLDPRDHALWMPFDEAMMHSCDVLIVAEMPGWKDSKGVTHEIEFFDRANKPIFHLDPISLVMRRVNRQPASAPVPSDINP